MEDGMTNPNNPLMTNTQDAFAGSTQKASDGAVATSDLANALKQWIGEHDANHDGAYSGAELKSFANALLDRVSEDVPSLEVNRAVILAAVDRVGTVSADQLQRIVTEAVSVMDRNGDGRIEPLEYQQLLRIAADKSAQR